GERSATSRRHSFHSLLYAFVYRGEFNRKRGSVAELDHREFVIYRRGLQHSSDRVLDMSDRLLHAPTDVYNKKNRYRTILERQEADFLFLSIIKESNIL